MLSSLLSFWISLPSACVSVNFVLENVNAISLVILCKMGKYFEMSYHINHFIIFLQPLTYGCVESSARSYTLLDLLPCLCEMMKYIFLSRYSSMDFVVATFRMTTNMILHKFHSFISLKNL